MTHRARIEAMTSAITALADDIGRLANEATLPDQSKIARKLDAARDRMGEMTMHLATAAGLPLRINPALAEIHSIVATTIRDIQRQIESQCSLGEVVAIEDIEPTLLAHEARKHAIHVAQTRAYEMLHHLTVALQGLKAGADAPGYGGSD